MERKINLFTVMIFVYSVVVCGLCKKNADVQEVFSRQWPGTEQPRLDGREATSGAQTLTASAAVHPVNQGN